ncbi:hypothetical protein B0H17DRAFT_1103343 [Mycena rosella]|uniref:Uncharacterized protein n=1 Tax=Mycena rosella TaxID=1033263 RepID=A0AAD7FXL2_MYCRO|nr:hypothetical protein B0H17DRAFT_1103343 [Mycena rosella]
MTLFDTNEHLISLRTDDPKCWSDFQTKSSHHYLPGNEEEVSEDQELHEDEEMGFDDSEIPTREVIQHVVTKKAAKNRKVKSDGTVGLVSSGVAEDVDAEVAGTDDVPANANVSAEGSSKRVRCPNMRYTEFFVSSQQCNTQFTA